MTDLMVAGLSLGLVLAAMAAMAVLDARRAVVDPRLVLALLAAVALPIAIAQWRGRRWPLYPGDAMMLGAFGFLLGPVGLAWTMLLGSAFSLAYRVWVQRRRGRRIRKGLVPLGPGMTAGAAVVFLCVNFGVAFAAGEPPPHGVPAVTGTAATVTVSPLPDIVLDAAPLPATELAPAGAVLPESIATRELGVRATRSRFLPGGGPAPVFPVGHLDGDRRNARHGLPAGPRSCPIRHRSAWSGGALLPACSTASRC